MIVGCGHASVRIVCCVFRLALVAAFIIYKCISTNVLCARMCAHALALFYSALVMHMCVHIYYCVVCACMCAHCLLCLPSRIGCCICVYMYVYYDIVWECVVAH